MRNKLLKLLLCISLALQVNSSFARNANNPYEGLPPEYIKNLKEGESLISHETETKHIDGRTTKIKSFIKCTSSLASSCNQIAYSQTEQQPIVMNAEFYHISTDGNHLVQTKVQQIKDKKESNRVSVKVAKNPKNPDAAKDEASTEINFDNLNPDTLNLQDQKTWESVGNIAAMGIVQISNGLQNYKNSVNLSKQLYESHKKALSNYKASVDKINDNINAYINQYKSNIYMLDILSNAQLDPSSIDKLKQQNLKDNEIINASLQDDLAYKEYELTELAQKNIISIAKKAIKERDYTKLGNYVEQLQYQSNQKLPETEAFLEQILSKSGIIQLNKVSDEAGPLDEVYYSTPLKSEYGQVVRRIANNLQIEYAGSNNLEYSTEQQKEFFTLSLSLLNLADHNLANKNNAKGEAYLIAANLLYEGATGFTSGLVEGLASIATSIPETAKLLKDIGTYVLNNPEDAYSKSINAIGALPEIAATATLAISQSLDELEQASVHDKAKFIGKLSADFVAGYATLGGTKLLGSIKAGTKLADIGAKARKTLKLTEVVSENNKIAQKAVQTLNSLPEKNRSILKSASNNTNDSFKYLSTRSALETDKNLANKTHVTQYLDNLYLTPKSTEEYKDLTKSYNELYQKMQTVETKSFEGKVYRVVEHEVYDKQGQLIATNTVDSVFDMHPGTKWSNGRYSMPGDSAIYTSTSKNETEAWATILDEYDHHQEKIGKQDLIISNQNVTLSNVLDLTDIKTREKLGISFDDITEVSNKTENDYFYSITHQIGNISKNLNYDAIMAPSSVNGNGINIIILKDLNELPK